MKRLAITTIASILSIYSFSCINVHRTLLSGETYNEDPSYLLPDPKNIDSADLKSKMLTLLKNYKETGNIENYSDYAASLVYLGKFNEAKAIYQQIEIASPNRYTTASNLGTIYELTGKNDSAFYWIKKSIELNPLSHKGSEWIHLKILEYKLNGKESDNESILGLDFGTEEKPSNINDYNLIELRQHIVHQLSERTTFVKPKNKIVGSIYFDYGNILALTWNLESAIESYKMAKKYGYESPLMNDRVKHFEYEILLGKPADWLGISGFNSMSLNIFLFAFLVIFSVIAIYLVRAIIRRI